MYSPLVFMISALRLIGHECLWCRIPGALSHKHLINCLASEVSDSQTLLHAYPFQVSKRVGIGLNNTFKKLKSS